MKRIIIKQYEQAADEKVSIGGIKWLKKWDVCVQCDSREEAEALKARLLQHAKEQEPVSIKPIPNACAVCWGSGFDITGKPCPFNHGPVKFYTAPPAQQNQFNPDWDAMAVMVEEQQRMAKKIEMLKYALVDQETKYMDAMETLTEEGWVWDGDQWQRPKSRSDKLRDDGITRRPKGWDKEQEEKPEPVAWISADETWLIPKLIISDEPKDGYKPVYLAPPQREWQGLTDDEANELTYASIAEIEAKLKEKNNG